MSESSSTAPSLSDSSSTETSLPAPSKSFIPFLVFLFLTMTVDWTTEFNLIFIRVAYVTVQLTTLTVYLLICRKIFTSSSNEELRDEDKISVPLQKNWGETETKYQLMTTREYDFSQLKKLGTQTLMSALFAVFIHYKSSSVPLLLSSVIFGLTNLYSHPLVKVHLLGASLARPWKDENENPFSHLLSFMSDQTKEPTEEEDPTKKITEAGEEGQEKETQEKIEDSQNEPLSEEVVSNEKTNQTRKRKGKRNKHKN